MERNIVALCCVVGLLGLVAAATGFAAEGTRIKTSHVLRTSADDCLYPRSPASALGLTAAMSLILAQIIINVASCCLCCGPATQQHSNCVVLVTCCIISWFLFIIALLFFLSGAALNDQHSRNGIYYGSYSCPVVKPGVFAGAVFLGLVGMGLGVLFYILLTRSKTSVSSNSASVTHSGIAMGQPQFPPQDPVLVPQDTYTRRQVT